VKYLPWVLASLVLIGAYWSVSGARDEALREQGKVEELIRLREIAETKATETRRWATALADSAKMVRQEAEQARLRAESRAAAARRTAQETGGRLRTLLDSLGASTAPLDSLESAVVVQLAAKDSVIASQDRLILGLNGQVSVLEMALNQADERSLAIARERDSYKRQADAWHKAANPGLLKRASGLAVAAGLGYLAGRL